MMTPMMKVSHFLNGWNAKLHLREWRGNKSQINWWIDCMLQGMQGNLVFLVSHHFALGHPIKGNDQTEQSEITFGDDLQFTYY